MHSTWRIVLQKYRVYSLYWGEQREKREGMELGNIVPCAVCERWFAGGEVRVLYQCQKTEKGQCVKVGDARPDHRLNGSDEPGREPS